MADPAKTGSMRSAVQKLFQLHIWVIAKMVKSEDRSKRDDRKIGQNGRIVKWVKKDIIGKWVILDHRDNTRISGKWPKL